MTLKEFAEKVEVMNRDSGSLYAYIYDDGVYRLIGCEEQGYGHKWQINLVNYETKKIKCLATRVNKSNCVRKMFEYYVRLTH